MIRSATTAAASAAERRALAADVVSIERAWFPKRQPSAKWNETSLELRFSIAPKFSITVVWSVVRQGR